MIWLTIEQLKLIGVSRGVLARKRHQWTWRPTGERGRNGKPIQECLLESLPIDYQKRWLDADAAVKGCLTTEPDEPAEVGCAGRGLGADEAMAAAEARLTQALLRYRPEYRPSFLAEAQRLASIIERYDAVKPKRRRDSDGNFDYVAGIYQLAAETACNDSIVLGVEPSRAKPRSPHTLEAWSKEFKRDGLAVFLRKPGEARKPTDKRKAMISAEAAEWLNANWRKHPSPRHLHRNLKRAAAKSGWSIPSYGWVYRKYKDLPKVVSTITFEGQKAYTSKLAPYVPRDVRDIDALQILVGDHSVRDVTVMLPTGELTRPWLTVWQDLRTGLIWGWHLDLTPSSVTIGLAYANGVKNFGAQPLSIPDRDYYSYLYTDQGKDYRCKTLAGQTLEFKKAAAIEGGLNVLCTQRRVGLIDELGLKHLMARGYNAREKFVERTFKDLSAWEQNTFENEYCGRGIGHKPERWQRAWHRHEKLVKKIGMHAEWLRSESPFMMIDDYRDALAGRINEYNHSEHTRAVLGGATVVPITEYERLYRTRYEISDDALALLLMKAARRKIGKDGVQFFQPNWYFLHPEMSKFKGQEIEIRYTDGDWERVWAVLPDGQVVEAEAIGNSGVLNKNKRTMSLIAKQRAHEQKVAREFHFIQMSNYRGESVEDRLAAQLSSESPGPDTPDAERMAVNAAPKVINLTRFDKPKSTRTATAITAEQVETANVIEGIFRRTGDSAPIREEWEDE
jgi:transposase InsO family protein